MFNILRVALFPLCVMVLVLTGWTIEYVPDAVASRLGADAGWLWPVVLVGVWQTMRLLPDLDIHTEVDPPWETMQAMTLRDLYGDRL